MKAHYPTLVGDNDETYETTIAVVRYSSQSKDYRVIEVLQQVPQLVKDYRTKVNGEPIKYLEIHYLGQDRRLYTASKNKFVKEQLRKHNLKLSCYIIIFN